ncbi:MAG: 5-(carboxyamino)imidazole ribonucleotide mutase [Methanothrix sp.]|jgi:5-(carboxyamino)imidazole ribonucleotide mutase|uniref:N5-carboxyaminoimidazole ribonucleotide mutase n=1 Tax=Methanothrix thermoacetophila (strain DSM 6194 / JCM 14653 / NBRC 101360 / PT) TaxID=349307 RepID=A0B543_METTP|nr:MULTISPECIES: 5-(carboxyamino)imidazole ribonucleotide mutase [Methanothrix]ABK13817.1 Phosphoribosylaminoimidazole carboxylase [Methanothrix thermoacetophila PT]MBC7080009.1 5-(carboxyamino)imidazole ribonucleotide mutase [Methanothrix sp.]NPU88158.1 5-(carboxyamino)imidazole ribonucleotide mutase [Methanothrix sp.]
MPDVSIISGSRSDQHIVDRILRVLDEHGASYEHRVISAHRNPKELDQYIESSNARVFIAVAGMSAALPGAVAARTERPVIGVPVSGKLLGIDALLSIVQMPPGVPVACVGIDAGENAALLALRMLKS